MKVKLLIGRAGIGFVQNAGDEVDVDADEAKRMIAAGQAEPIAKTAAKRSKATKKPDETR